MLRSGGLDESRCSCRAVSSSSFWESLRMRARGRNRRRVEIERTRLPDALVRGGRVTRALLIRAKLVVSKTGPCRDLRVYMISMFSYELCIPSPYLYRIPPPAPRCISVVSLSESVPSRARTPLAPARRARRRRRRRPPASNGSAPLVARRRGGAFSGRGNQGGRRENFGDIDCKSLHLGPEIDATQTLLTATYLRTCMYRLLR